MTSDLRRLLAEGLATAEREYRDAQTALQRDGSDAARARYAQAERNYKRMEQLVKAASPHSASPARTLQNYAFSAPKKLKS